MLWQALQDCYDVQEELRSKRHKIEMHIKREGLGGEERIAVARVAVEERIADRQLDQVERIARIQADSALAQLEAQIKQTASFARVMERMIDVLGMGVEGVQVGGANKHRVSGGL